MKLVNLKIIITSILCILLIFIKVNTTRHNLEIDDFDTGKIISNSSNVKTQYTRKNDKLPLEDILTDFNNRRRHVSDMCEQYKSDIGKYGLIAKSLQVGSNVILSLKQFLQLSPSMRLSQTGTSTPILYNPLTLF